MTLEMAMDILSTQHPLYRPSVCKEYNDYFVFIINKNAFQAPMMMDKKNGKIFPFNPLVLEAKTCVKEYVLK